MRKSARLLMLPAVVALAVVSATPASATGPVVLSQGHVDVIGVAFEDGVFDVHVHDEEADIEYAPHEVQLVAKPGSRTTVPADPAYGFLGDPGDPVWILPELQDPNLLWPGIAAEEVESGVFVGDQLRVSLLGAIGPGDVSIFTVGVSGPTVLADTGNGTPDTINLTAGDHVHANWAFEAAGSYLLAVRVSGTLAATNQVVRSDIAIYCVKVQR